MTASAKQVPQVERDIAALNGREFGKNSVGDRGAPPDGLCGHVAGGGS
jgi:hypothetical protein